MDVTDTGGIGSSWVLNPNHKLEDIEAEFDESANGYEQSSKDWNYRGAEDGAAFLCSRLIQRPGSSMWGAVRDWWAVSLPMRVLLR